MPMNRRPCRTGFRREEPLLLLLPMKARRRYWLARWARLARCFVTLEVGPGRPRCPRRCGYRSRAQRPVYRSDRRQRTAWQGRSACHVRDPGSPSRAGDRVSRGERGSPDTAGRAADASAPSSGPGRSPWRDDAQHHYDPECLARRGSGCLRQGARLSDRHGHRRDAGDCRDQRLTASRRSGGRTGSFMLMNPSRLGDDFG